ncbi:MAG: DUF2147 domain-containing protein [Bacteroidales bacterium]|jgi:uncharacterized protein (DUF2147 family)|nr:DUF2147 domain-containing protein [Bacteroidales bacterium]MCR5115632.1 DUF2147 domain-containing protein [Bacteroidales bacterium]
MKKIAAIFVTILLCSWTLGTFAQSKADAICGYYYAKDPFSKEGSQVKIYKAKDGTYEGIVCWVENPAKKNFINYKFLRGFHYNAKDNEWQDGTIHHPGSGKTYKSYMKFDDKGKLKVRGYVGFSLLGATVTWTRETKQRIQK